MKSYLLSILILLSFFLISCKTNAPVDDLKNLSVEYVSINSKYMSNNGSVYNIPIDSAFVKIIFSGKIDVQKIDSTKFVISNINYSDINLLQSDNEKTLLFTLKKNLNNFKSYNLIIQSGKQFGANVTDNFSGYFITELDSTPKFPTISEEELLTLVQKQTFKYFWDYAHPVSGLARERFGSGETVTTGGSGFGVMTIPIAIERGFITRQQGLDRMNTIVNFLKNTADKFHGAFPHWMNGTTGKVQPFTTKDNGADLIETSFLIQGLLTVQQYFNQNTTQEKTLYSDIESIWRGVEWSWFQQNGQQKLYWHWSPNYNWDMNMPITGWNEGLIAYVLAASSPTFPITKSVYDEGWARNGAIKNGNKFYDIILPLGESYGGPLFFSHYSFLGLDPRNLLDTYANYWTQNTAHAEINYSYCVANPHKNFGYSKDCWGLTASDIPNSYTASSPTNDVSVIAPTAALSSFPYTPQESMQALHYFYYILGDKIWGEYGFKDAFSLNKHWFADSYLAIDQGPIVVMIENYRTGLLWNLFMKNQDIKNGLTKLGFTY